MDPKPDRKKKSRRGKQCAAFGCVNSEYQRDGTSSGLRFFRFPNKTLWRKQWCNLIKRQQGRDGFFVTSNTVLCEEHFQPEDIYKPPGGSRSKLREGKSECIDIIIKKFKQIGQNSII